MMFGKPAAQVDTGVAGHDNVADDHLHFLLGDCLAGSRDAFCLHNLVPGRLQKTSQHRSYGIIVVNDENYRHLAPPDVERVSQFIHPSLIGAASRNFAGFPVRDISSVGQGIGGAACVLW